MTAILAERLSREKKQYESLIRQGVPEGLGVTVMQEHFGYDFYDMILHADLTVRRPKTERGKKPGVAMLASVRMREQSKRKFDQFTKTAWQADGSKGELFTGHDKLCFYGWQQDDEVTECYLVDMERLRALTILMYLLPDDQAIPGGHDRKQNAWGWNFPRLEERNLILGHWTA